MSEKPIPPQSEIMSMGNMGEAFGSALKWGGSKEKTSSNKTETHTPENEKNEEVNKKNENLKQAWEELQKWQETPPEQRAALSRETLLAAAEYDLMLKEEENAQELVDETSVEGTLESANPANNYRKYLEKNDVKSVRTGDADPNESAKTIENLEEISKSYLERNTQELETPAFMTPEKSTVVAPSHEEIMSIFEHAKYETKIDVARAGIRGAFRTLGTEYLDTHNPNIHEARGENIRDVMFDTKPDEIEGTTVRNPQVFFQTVQATRTEGPFYNRKEITEDTDEVLVVVRLNNNFQNPHENTVMVIQAKQVLGKPVIDGNALVQVMSEFDYDRNTSLENNSLMSQWLRGEHTMDSYKTTFAKRENKTLEEFQADIDKKLANTSENWRTENGEGDKLIENLERSYIATIEENRQKEKAEHERVQEEKKEKEKELQLLQNQRYGQRAKYGRVFNEVPDIKTDEARETFDATIAKIEVFMQHVEVVLVKSTAEDNLINITETHISKAIEDMINEANFDTETISIAGLEAHIKIKVEELNAQKKKKKDQPRGSSGSRSTSSSTTPNSTSSRDSSVAEPETTSESQDNSNDNRQNNRGNRNNSQQGDRGRSNNNRGGSDQSRNRGGRDKRRGDNDSRGRQNRNNNESAA